MMVPSATNPPGVDLDKVAASISEQNQTSAAPVTVPVSQTRQFGRSLAGVLSGAAQNIKSKIAGMGAASPSASSLSSQSRGEVQQVRAESGANYSLTTGSSSNNLVEPANRSPQAEIQQREYGELGKAAQHRNIVLVCIMSHKYTPK